MGPNGPHVAITGASSGIGAALAREYARAGARLTLVARRRDWLERLAVEVGGECQVVAQDLSDPATACDWIPAAEASFGPIDTLINNAGVQILGPLAAAEVAAGETLLRTNLLTPLRLMRALLPAMIERRAGTIVNVASMASITPTPALVFYSASKAGLAAASEALRAELRGSGVRVLTVYPGVVDTAMAKTAIEGFAPSRALALVPHGTGEGLARQIRRSVERGRARVIYPSSYRIAAWFPGLSRWFVARFSPKPRSGS